VPGRCLGAGTRRRRGEIDGVGHVFKYGLRQRSAGLRPRAMSSLDMTRVWCARDAAPIFGWLRFS
jgi:hypothetical protein